VPATTTIAGLHTILQTTFGWSGQYLHRFVIGGTEYGIAYPGGPGFRDDAREVRLTDLGLREGERFCYHSAPLRRLLQRAGRSARSTTWPP
jgi:hypothetical protein